MKVNCIPGVKRGCLLIQIEGETWKDIYTCIWGNKPVFPQDSPSLPFFAERFYELEYPVAKQYALRKLAIRGYFSQELYAALKKAYVSERTASRVIQEMTRLGFLNDQAQSERWIRSQAAKKWGPYVIVQKLKAKGVTIEDFSQLLAEEYGTEERKKQIHALLSKKLASKRTVLYPARQKAISSLIRKGFDLQEIQEVIADHFCT